MKEGCCSVEPEELIIDKNLDKFTADKKHIRIKSEYLTGEDISDKFKLSSAVMIIENGKILGSRSNLLEQFPTESGVYLVLIREFRARRWIPVYVGQAASGLRRRMRDYIHKDRFILDNEGKKLKKISFEVLSKKSSISVQIRMFSVGSPQKAIEIEKTLLSEIDFPLNARENYKYRSIEHPTEKNRLILSVH
jgi:excinuclease UvrABC nuclease subunit